MQRDRVDAIAEGAQSRMLSRDGAPGHLRNPRVAHFGFEAVGLEAGVVHRGACRGHYRRESFNAREMSVDATSAKQA